jgi:hypothetical protein
MHPRVAEVLDFFETHRVGLLRASAAVPLHLTVRRPTPGQWSVAETLAHVAIVERRVMQLLRSRIEAATASALGPELESGSVVPSVDVGRLLDRTRRITTNPSSQPPAAADADRAWNELEETRRDLRALLLQFDGVALSKVVLPNPVLGPIDVYQWVVFLAGHEARHAAQIEEVGALIASVTAD